MGGLLLAGDTTPGDCKSGSCDTREGLHVVDLYDGTILWTFTNGSMTSSTNSTDMDYSIPGPGGHRRFGQRQLHRSGLYRRHVGNMWRFKLCLSTDNYCAPTAGRTSPRPGAAICSSIPPRETSGPSIRAHWTPSAICGSIGARGQDGPHGIQCPGALLRPQGQRPTTTYTTSNIDNPTSANQTYDTTKAGWRAPLAGGGEKILADPTVFGGVVYFTTYTPASGNNPCEQGGTASLYGVNYNTGAGALSEGARA